VRGTIGVADFRCDGHPKFFLVSNVCGVLSGLPAKLWAAIQCLRLVVSEGPSTEDGSRLTCDSLCER
jgi:hypothetical protein